MHIRMLIFYRAFARMAAAQKLITSSGRSTSAMRQLSSECCSDGVTSVYCSLLNVVSFDFWLQICNGGSKELDD